MCSQEGEKEREQQNELTTVRRICNAPTRVAIFKGILEIGLFWFLPHCNSLDPRSFEEGLSSYYAFDF